jgi:calcium/calmodulin-dependent protein kinase (CaM kinase) II/calcium/calmodulin-dependent protein kinase I
MWSLGVVLYILIGGYRPFRGSGTEIMRQIRYGEYEFHEQYWNHVSREAKDLIKRMMTVHPVKRITAAEALESDWMVADDSTLQSDLSPNQTGLRAFNGKAKMRKVVQMVSFFLDLSSVIRVLSHPHASLLLYDTLDR